MTFLDTLTHPNHKALATALMAGVTYSSLVAIYGKTRVQAMTERIKNFNAGTYTGIKIETCKHCFSDIRGLCKITSS